MVSICLNMIVKNEHKNVSRLFDSVIDIIDTYCICDTGSTDETISTIQKYFDDKNIKGKIIQKEFLNFEFNRNYALYACEGMSDYILLLDADMTITYSKKFNKTDILGYDVIFLLQGEMDKWFHKNPRIVKNNKNMFKYIGVTHEYLSYYTDTKTHIFNKDVLFINDFGDGGCKTDKYVRDIKLLTEGIKNDPLNTRYHFYLANSYYDNGEYNNAIKIYKRNIELNGWKEEIWYSYYRIGLCYKNLQKTKRSTKYWLKAIKYSPNRLENIYQLVEYYTNTSQHNIALIYYIYALNVIVNIKDDTIINEFLFAEFDKYIYKFDTLYTIFAAYLGYRKIDTQIMNVLKNADNLERYNLLSNIKFYDIELPCAIHTIDFTDSMIYEHNSKIYNMRSSSSCLIPYKLRETEYIMNVRYVNYSIDHSNGSYSDCDEHILTINKMYMLDKKFKILSQKLLTNENNDNSLHIIGIEDIRIFKDTNDDIKFIGTTCHDTNPGMSIGNYIYPRLNYEKLSTSIELNGGEIRCEKNWVYLNYKEDDYMIYDWYPNLRICKIIDNTLELVESKPMPLVFNNLRGSSNGYNYKNQTWFVCHIVSYENPRQYYHMFVVFDNNMELIQYSRLFKFENDAAIQYCLSVIVNDDNIVCNYSLWDSCTKIKIYNKHDISQIMFDHHKSN